MEAAPLHIDGSRLMKRLDCLAQVGATAEGGCNRVALTDADKAGRDLVRSWMADLQLEVTVDSIGNIIGTRGGRHPELTPVMTGSHIDTVANGGRYDGAYGVLAGLEVVAALNEAGVETARPLAVAAFTNEEGVRYQPDMMGSLLWAGGLALDEALATTGSDGSILGEELARIGYAGQTACGSFSPYAFVELHIEQGPVLCRTGETIGAVVNLQGISWQEITICGTSNHAGTTPMSMRRDAGYGAAEIATFVRRLALRMGGAQVGTVGAVKLKPNLINVIAREAVLTVDLRNTDELLLQAAERELADFLAELSEREQLTMASKVLARFEPVVFDPQIVETVILSARSLGFEPRRMTSGAGHDAQMMSRICPAAMIFVPSVEGVSHNPREHTEPSDLVAGADVLLQTLATLAAQTSGIDARTPALS